MGLYIYILFGVRQQYKAEKLQDLSIIKVKNGETARVDRMCEQN